MPTGSTGAVAIGDHAPVGSTVQFQVRDADAASGDLRDLTAAWHADSALAFTCNGRGSNLFGRPGPDAEALVDGLDTTAVAGMSCAGEIGTRRGAGTSSTASPPPPSFSVPSLLPEASVGGRTVPFRFGPRG